jgi:hypothetical protein
MAPAQPDPNQIHEAVEALQAQVQALVKKVASLEKAPGERQGE